MRGVLQCLSATADVPTSCRAQEASDLSIDDTGCLPAQRVWVTLMQLWLRFDCINWPCSQ